MAKASKSAPVAAKVVPPRAMPRWVPYVEYGVTYVLHLPVDMLLAAGAGMAFDMVLGTRAWPVFLLVALMGFFFHTRQTVDEGALWPRLGYLIGAIGIGWPRALLVAVVLTFALPVVAKPMTAVVGYNGPLYLLVLWGGIAGVCLTLVNLLVGYAFERLNQRIAGSA